MKLHRLAIPTTLAVAALAVSVAGCGTPNPAPDTGTDTGADAATDARVDACASPNFMCVPTTGGGMCNPQFVCTETECPSGCQALPPI